MHDCGGLDPTSFEVIADFAVNDIPAGQNLASSSSPAIRCLAVAVIRPLRTPRGRLTVSVRDRQGNVTQIDQTFSAGRSGSWAQAALLVPAWLTVASSIHADRHK
jgi:hypothetical protein